MNTTKFSNHSNWLTIWQTISNIFIGSGLILLSIGSWQAYQYQLEINQPPPVPILPDNTATVTPFFSPSPTVVETISLKIESKKERLATTTLTNSPTLTATSMPKTTATAVMPTPLPTITDTPPLKKIPLPPQPTHDPNKAEVTRIVAESIGLDTKVIEVGWRKSIQNGVTSNVWVVADYVAGRHINSKLPGEGGNIVISAHHNIKGEVFRYIVNLKSGAVVTLYEGEQSFPYVVTEKFLVKDKDEPESVRLENAKWIGTFNEERLTLITCWPYIGNSHRVIVIAKPMVNK